MALVVTLFCLLFQYFQLVALEMFCLDIELMILSSNCLTGTSSSFLAPFKASIWLRTFSLRSCSLTSALCVFSSARPILASVSDIPNLSFKSAVRSLASVTLSNDKAAVVACLMY